MWAQIVVRAQIPLMISIKNAFSCLRGITGYGAFIDYFFWSFVISAGCVVTLVCVPSLPVQVVYLLAAIVFILLGTLMCAVSHTRTAFKEKYLLASCLPPGCHFWDMLWDIAVSVLCMPCSLAQMARHVFQYDRMDTRLGFFMKDPSTLPPLRQDLESGDAPFHRPGRADTAGLTWTYNERHPQGRDNTGAAHRQQEIYARQQNQMREEHLAATASAPAVATARPQQVVYNADGTVSKN